MNITTIANFGARFAMGMRCALRPTSLRKNLSGSDRLVRRACMEDAMSKPARLTAIWQVNPQNGHVECHWTTDPEAIASYQALPVLERFGLILAASQQNRTSQRLRG